MKRIITNTSGFSLVELAMVLLIVSLLLGGLLMPLASQIEARQRSQAKEQIEQIKEALIGYAIIHGRLPCYTLETDPTNPDYGEEAVSCEPELLTSDGILPWKTLGLDKGYDPWGGPRRSAAEPWNGYWRYRPDRNFVENFTLSTVDADQLRVIDSNGDLLTSCCSTGTPRSQFPIAIIYSTGPDLEPGGENALYQQTAADNPTYQGGPQAGEFDDITVWITRPLLFNRLVTAGRLP